MMARTAPNLQPPRIADQLLRAPLLRIEGRLEAPRLEPERRQLLISAATRSHREKRPGALLGVPGFLHIDGSLVRENRRNGPHADHERLRSGSAKARVPDRPPAGGLGW